MATSGNSALHTQVADFSGQGDNLHILATIYPAQNKLVDAEKTSATESTDA